MNRRRRRKNRGRISRVPGKDRMGGREEGRRRRGRQRGGGGGGGSCGRRGGRAGRRLSVLRGSPVWEDVLTRSNTSLHWPSHFGTASIPSASPVVRVMLVIHAPGVPGRRVTQRDPKKGCS